MNEDEAWALLERCEGNEQVVIEIALAVMQSKGWIEEPDGELIETLRRLYQANPMCQLKVKFTGEVLHDTCAGRPGEYLAAAWERECEEHWERHEAPRWSCPCGVTFGLITWGGRNAHFYTLSEDGLFNEQVADCPDCQRNLARVRGENRTGQLGLF